MTAQKPAEDMKALDRLVGTWLASGGIDGNVTFEWMNGGFFLIQHVDIVREGHANRGIEIIGHEQLFGADAPSDDIKSRFYGSDGSTFDYVYEIEGDTLTIWGGQKGSAAFFKGTFSPDGRTLDGGWVWPGGGYDATMKRMG